jgi:HSP20 family protein
VIDQRPSLRTSMQQLLQDTLGYPALPPPRPTADVYESVDGEAYVVEMPLPGLQSSEIGIEATADTLTVSTRPASVDASDSGRRYLQREQETGAMARVFEFPSEIDPDNITANLEHGMLNIRLPKAVAAKRRVIKLQ